VSTRISVPPAPSGVDWSPVRWLVGALGRRLGRPPLRFRLWDGSEHELAPHPVATVALGKPRTLLRLLRDPETGLAEEYRAGRVEVDGDLVEAIAAVDRACAEAPPSAGPASPAFSALSASRRNARRHYDLGNDFYRLWLDEQLLYSCAFFPSPDFSLEEAQVAKMERVCRKLQLRPGETVVEAGGGWGALALHMARCHGVRVTAYNVSREQVAYAADRARREGLADRVRFVEDDYRRIEGRFDAFVSVGMVEHVGRESYQALGQVIDRCLAPTHGRGLLHFIGRDRPRALSAWIRKRIFPGAYPPTLAEAVSGILEPVRLSVLDVENLRRHYALTLDHWRRRFAAAEDEVERRFGREFTRSWRLYLAGSEAAFASGSLQLFQVTFTRPGDNEIPWTRPSG
jgi:cyclopropane-fatty-acyl-phospholipid synthase